MLTLLCDLRSVSENIESLRPPYLGSWIYLKEVRILYFSSKNDNSCLYYENRLSSPLHIIFIEIRSFYIVGWLSNWASPRFRSVWGAFCFKLFFMLDSFSVTLKKFLILFSFKSYIILCIRSESNIFLNQILGFHPQMYDNASPKNTREY